RHGRDRQRAEQLTDAAHRLARQQLIKNPLLLCFERVVFHGAAAELVEPCAPAPFVLLDPDPDLIAPLLGRQRSAITLENAAMRFELRRFAVEDDAVEVKDNSRELG